MNLSITGKLGSGKSTICKELEAEGYEIITAGSIFREIATERGISVVELNEQAKTDSSLDTLIDTRTTELSEQKDKCIFDCRLGWFFAPKTIKIFVDVDINVAARRVMNDTRRTAESYATLDDAVIGIMKRQEMERDRFLALYKADIYDMSNYDLVINSTDTDAKALATLILNAIDQFKA